MSQTESVLEDSSSSAEKISLLLFNSRESSLHTSQFYFTTDSPISEYSTQKSLPIDMKYNDGHRLAIVAYTLLMITSAIGNITVLAEILGHWRKGRLSRINLFLLHLSIADLLVTFLMMPLEIGWNATVSWDAGDGMCRFMSFFRIFGLFLSSFILVCISLDRYFAVLNPLGIVDAKRRGRIMISIAWVASFACSLPQSFIFHVETHPEFKWYQQCVTFNSFPSLKAELAYNLFGFFFLYGFPLIMIIFCYTQILYKIYRVNTTKRDEYQLRRSNMGALARAKRKTLKMTIIIVTTFCFCWTPYNVMSLWYWFDSKSAQAVDQRIQKAFFIFACTNSCANPIIYGLFHLGGKGKSYSLPELIFRVCQKNQAQTSENNKRKFNQCFQPGSSHVSVSPRTTASQKDLLHTNEPKRVSSASARPFSTRSLSISTQRFNHTSSSQGRGFRSQYPVSGTVQTEVVSRNGKGAVNMVKNSEMKCFNNDERGKQRSYLTSMV